jgi:hypothetical protein
VNFLDNQRKSLSEKDLECTDYYGKKYRKVIKEQRKEKKNTHILNANNKTTAVWQIINKLGNEY